MGRPLRPQIAGACYWIELQGNNRQDIFLSAQDRRCYLNLLRAHKERYQFQVYAFTLLPNKIQLLIETARPNISKAMQAFNTAYTKYFNAAHNTVGHVFQGRYKAFLVDREHSLLDATCAVHLECLRSGLTAKPWRYQWSSCAAYVASQGPEPLVETEPVLRRLAKIRLQQSVRYLRVIQERMKGGAWEPPRVSRGLYIGPEAFIAKMEALRGRPASGVKIADDPGRMVAETAARHGLKEEALYGRSQWREVVAVRREAMLRLWREAKLGVTEIARLFQRTPSAVSQAIRAASSPRAS